ncbi:MAG: ExbD/TolR family protein [Luteolibacter sp.]
MPVQLNSGPSDDGHGDEARIEIIPLIDIMFFLLASFMMVSLSMTQLNRVPINLPEASTGVPDPKAPPFQIAVDSNGVITWDAQLVTLSEITTRLQRGTDPAESRVLISADADARHRHVLDVLNAVRAAGVDQVSFESKTPQP